MALVSVGVALVILATRGHCRGRGTCRRGRVSATLPAALVLMATRLSLMLWWPVVLVAVDLCSVDRCSVDCCSHYRGSWLMFVPTTYFLCCTTDLIVPWADATSVQLARVALTHERNVPVEIRLD